MNRLAALSVSFAPRRSATSMLGTLTLVVCVASGCPADVGGKNSAGPSAGQTPSDSLKATYAAASAGDIKGFKSGLSANFVTTIDRLQELSKQKPELKGAFAWEVLMRETKRRGPIPTEEFIKKDRATVRALDKNGMNVKANMRFEDGRWKMMVPGGIVKAMDNMGHIQKIARGEQIEDTPKLPRGGGGKADRTKKLAPDATAAEKARAGALDTFDLGVLASAETALTHALSLNENDEELTIALGRCLVQQDKADAAVALFEAHLKKFPKSVGVNHYAGMGYMMKNRYADAAKVWRTVVELDPKYGEKNHLAKRAEVAESFAAKAAAGEGHGAVSTPQAPPKPTK